MSLAILQRNLPSLIRWQIHYGRDKAPRVAAPSATTSNRTASIGADRAVIAANNEASAGGKDVLKCIAAVNANLQHATVKAEVRVLV